MYMEPEKIICKNGKEYKMTSIGPNNAVEYLDLMYQVSSDTHFMTRYGDEVKRDEAGVEAEKARLKRLADDERQAMISVFDGDKIIGNVAVYSSGAIHRKMAHRCSMGIGIRKEYRGLGLGNILVNRAIKFAKESGYELMELGVLSDNEPARSLYEKMGFTEWGRLPDAFRLDCGKSIDEITMYKKL
ncbi:MAG: GNAT family N-acetyltransferase [Butyrivibrio sp.]|nr:GNAT family N-acetyltransferase [Butyrivibrio sp.]